MKITYDKRKTKPVVAFVSGGELYLKSRCGNNLVFSPYGLPYLGFLAWEDVLAEVTPDQVFYEGDTITITF
jgi:hypothetical protein